MIARKRMKPTTQTAVEICKSRPLPSAARKPSSPMTAFIARPTTIRTTIPPDWPIERIIPAIEIASLLSSGLGVQTAPKQLPGLSTQTSSITYAQ